MGANTFGKIYKLTTFGESHGTAIGGVIDGCPANLKLDLEAIQLELSRRRPGQSSIVTQRKESDTVEFLSGIIEGVTTGAPIGFIIKNNDQKSKDYQEFSTVFRPNHADFTYQKKYGIRHIAGGGRSSARETACRIVAGAIAKQALKNIQFFAYVSQVGPIKVEKNYQELPLHAIDDHITRCPDLEMAQKMEDFIKDIRKQGDTIGGIITGVIKNVPIGLGEPIYDKLHAVLGAAMLSINAVKGFEYGHGFEAVLQKGSEHNDIFMEDGTTKTNFSGGIQGGISNGMDIVFRVAFKPVATIMKTQQSIDDTGKIADITGKGRHDPCVVPRAVPIVEAMAAMVILDFYLMQKTNHL